MDELNRKINVFAALQKKSEFKLDSLSERLKEDSERHKIANRKLNTTLNELKKLDLNIQKAMSEQLDISEIKSLNLYAEKIHLDKVQHEFSFNNSRSQLEHTKTEIIKVMSKVKVYENILDSTRESIELSAIKNNDKEAEDLWLAKRTAR